MGEERAGSIGFPRWQEPGEIGKNYVILHNRKRTKMREPLRKACEPVVKGTGIGQIRPLCGEIIPGATPI